MIFSASSSVQRIRTLLQVVASVVRWLCGI